ncbi:MAG: DUF4956 domain-containing protein [Chlorobi bacterium]|nr:DUF4956 domain-containing protein [Chlorobiota bacterium]
MNKWELFQKFLITQNEQINIESLLINSLILIVIILFLEFTYYKCANSLSNKKMFAENFLLTAFTTMVIISIVKSSLALSLGLVGALSIVRFRTAIKEPEELSYLFFTIAAGLGTGADQVGVTVVASLILFAIIWTRFFLTKRKKEYQNLFLTVSDSSKSAELKEVSKLINKYFIKSKLKRFSDNSEQTEMSFYADVKNLNQLEEFKKELKKLYNSAEINFIDNHV